MNIPTHTYWCDVHRCFGWKTATRPYSCHKRYMGAMGRCDLALVRVTPAAEPKPLTCHFCGAIFPNDHGPRCIL